MCLLRKDDKTLIFSVSRCAEPSPLACMGRYACPMPGPRFLADNQLAAIAWADEDVTNVDLAELLGLPRDRVWAVRRRIKDAGHWSCPLVWRTCPECGDLIASGVPPHDRRLHPICATQRGRDGWRRFSDQWRANNPEQYRASRERAKARARAEWPQLPADERAAKLATFAADNQRDHARTLPHATRTGQRWTPAEDAVLVARADEPDREVAIALGRTLWSVRSRKTVLRRRGDLPSR